MCFIMLAWLAAMGLTNANADEGTAAAPPEQAPLSAPQTNVDRAAELQREIDILGQEVEKLKNGPAAEEPTANQETLGFGPAASKVYRTSQGLSFGGYGEVLFEDFRNGYNAPGKYLAPGEDVKPQNGQAQVDITRAVLYSGYKFNDQWVFNSELEWEHGGDEFEVEFLYLDYFWKKELNFRMGELLMPVGLTNETHEPTTYLGTHRPLVETLIIPTTWSEYGAGAFGDLGPFTYRAYLVTGLNATGFTDKGIRGGLQERGFVNATNWGFVGRADYTALPGLLAGGSVYVGNAGTTDISGIGYLAVPMRMIEAHAEYIWKAWDLRALGAYTWLSRVDALNSALALSPAGGSVGSEQGGYYLQAGYDILNGSNQSFIPFVRWETTDTQLAIAPGSTSNGADLIHEIIAGVNYKPIPQLVFKADYQWYLMEDHSGVNQWNLAMGYVF